jgi:hypothetical protein
VAIAIARAGAGSRLKHFPIRQRVFGFFSNAGIGVGSEDFSRRRLLGRREV